MRIFFNPLIKLMAVFAAIGILAACGDNDLGDSNELMYDYCVYDATQKCLFGPFKECQSGGLLSNSCPYQDVTISSSSSITTGGGTSSSSSIGGGANQSLDGVWGIGDTKITISGNAGVYSQIGAATGRTLDAVNKGYITLGGEQWRNITSTGNFTWSGQSLAITYNTSSPNVAIGINWISCTITMSADGQTIEVTTHNGTDTWTRGNYSLNGVWGIGDTKITISGNAGVYSQIGAATGRTLDAVNKGYITLGGEQWRNITSTGNFTWSGQSLAITYNTSSPNVATGINWISCTITMSADGQTIEVTTHNGTDTWTRKQ